MPQCLGLVQPFYLHLNMCKSVVEINLREVCGRLVFVVCAEKISKNLPRLCKSCVFECDLLVG